MKVVFKKSYVQVESPTLVLYFGRLVTGTDNAKAGAFFPFIFVRDAEFTPERLINHELIHFRQEIETLFIGVFLISLVERLYARIFLKKNKFERYIYTAMEQEAYLNMNNLDYLGTRKWGSLLYYVFHKKNFKVLDSGDIQYQ